MFMSLKDRKRRLAPTRLRATATPTVTTAPAPTTRESPVQVAASLATLSPVAREEELVRLQSDRGNYFVTSVLAQMPKLPGVGDPDQTSTGSTPTEGTSGGNDLSPADQARLTELQDQLSQIVAQIRSLRQALETVQDPAQRAALEQQLQALELQAAALEHEIATLTGAEDDSKANDELLLLLLGAS